MPRTFVPVKSIFSLMNNTWSVERGRNNENTVRGLMVCKINFDFTCKEFYKN